VSGAQKVILYVEDHPPARLLMGAIIADLTSHRLITAEDGDAALRLAKESKPNLYIVDLDLPDTDGQTLAAHLNLTHPASIILVSAYAEAVTREKITERGYEYLAKPLDPDLVAETIRRVLAG
jgi:two-component system chemotaxis response regulator CheY